MRLIETSTFELHDIGIKVDYAILSHRWSFDEIIFPRYDAERIRSLEKPSPAIEKIRGACAQARKDGWAWIWIDSCCIDKTSSEELSKSLNQMFKWYEQAKVCYTYLSDVNRASHTELGTLLRTKSGLPSVWFQRGWTLQELIAPKALIFFDTTWSFIGTRGELSSEIEEITGINRCYLDGGQSFRTATIATKFSWAAGRETTEAEDIAYSLLGILGVFMHPRYGEGKEAFMRLQRKLLASSTDETLFAWMATERQLPPHSQSSHWKSDEWGLLAPSPDCFRHSRHIQLGQGIREASTTAFAVSPQGISFPFGGEENQTTTRWVGFLHFIIPFSPVCIAYYRHRKREIFVLTLNCYVIDQHGVERPVEIYLHRDGKGDDLWRRCQCGHLGYGPRRRLLRVDAGMTTATMIQPDGVMWED